MLLAHVLNLHLEKLPVGQGHAQDVARAVRVDVDLYNLVVVDQDDAVAYRREPLAHPLGVAVIVARADELGAVGEVYLALVKLGEVGPVLYLGGGAGLVLLRGHVGLAAQDGERRLEDEDVALASGVDHAGALEDGVEVHRVGQGLLRGLNGAGEHELEVAAVLGEFDRAARRHAGDGEDGALGGLHHGLVRRVDAGGHRLGEEAGVGRVAPLELLREAAEEQAEYDAGVAARAAQHRARRAVRRRAQRVEVALGELRRRGAHGQGHVRARVAVRHGEDVEIVNELPVLLQRRAGADDYVAEQRRINLFFQEALPPSVFYLTFRKPPRAAWDFIPSKRRLKPPCRA